MQVIISDNYAYKCCRYLCIKAETRHGVRHKPGKVRDMYPNLIFTTWETVDRPRQVIVSDMTAFKCSVFFRHFLFYEPGKGVAVNLANFGYLPLGETLLEKFPDEILLSGQLVFVGGILPAFRTAKDNPFHLLPGKGLFSPLADKVALDFGRQAEGKCRHLALNVLAKSIVVLR